jgi:hypothetical protein
VDNDLVNMVTTNNGQGEFSSNFHDNYDYQDDYDNYDDYDQYDG